jgi:fructoselysine-6-P-deglycase FrlB-like protein
MVQLVDDTIRRFVMTYLSYEEIHSQHRAHVKTVDYLLQNGKRIADFFALSGDVVFIGCGSSYWNSLSAYKTMRLFTGIRSYAVKAADVLICPEEFKDLYSDPVFICPSRSGLTKELLGAVKILKSLYPRGRVVSITEYEDNKLAGISDLNFNTSWAKESSVCQTRSMANLYTAAVTMAAIIGQKYDFIEGLKRYLTIAPELYSEHESFIKTITDPANIDAVTCLGTGLQFGITIAGAYIVIEMAEFNANYFQLLEYRHGPIVTAGEKTAVFICSSDQSAGYEKKLAGEIRETGARVFAVTPVNRTWADHSFCIGGGFDKEITALHFAFVLQSFAFHFSVARGKNPDNPGKLVQYIDY